MALTEDQIRERLKIAQLTLSTSRQNIFSSDVPERVKRNIVKIFLFGDGTNRTVEIEKVEEDDTYTMWFDNVNVTATDNVQLPAGAINVKAPIIVLEGGTNLSFIASAGAPECTICYWDDEI